MNPITDFYTSFDDCAVGLSCPEEKFLLPNAIHSATNANDAQSAEQTACNMAEIRVTSESEVDAR